jgi:hypothetical protein
VGVAGGCVYDNDPPRNLAPGAESATGAGPVGSTAPPGSAGPMLVDVDTDQVLNAGPGDGVGVYVEYGKGGHWHVWWTCDTNKTQESCDFAVTFTVASGKIANVNGNELAGGFFSSPSATEVDASSTTTTAVNGLRFDTDAGAVLTVKAAVGGLTDGAFLFFVQNGKLNGGFQGVLTNPLELQGSAP